MQNPIHFQKTVSGNRLKIALFSLGGFIIIIAGLYYYLSFKKSHIPQTIEGTWVCQQYLDSIAEKKSVAQVVDAPIFLQMAFKKGWVDSVVCTGITSTYKLQLKKLSKGKYLLTRFADTIGTIRIKKQFFFTESWNSAKWQYVKVDTAFKQLDKGNVFRSRLNRILVSGTYLSIQGKGLKKEVTFSDSGSVTGINGVNSFKICYGADCYFNTLPKDAIFIGNESSLSKYAFEIRGDTLNIYTLSSDPKNRFKIYWKFLKKN